MSEPGRTRRAARAATAGGRASARAVAGGSRAMAGGFHRLTRADGADETGLARLTELHAVSVAGDAALTVALAGTVFAMPTGQARGQVAVFLALTMAPFAILAPLVGPLLDRFRHGRRWAIGFTFATRGFLSWVLASAIVEHSAWLFPVALGCLIGSKTYYVAKAAAVPRLVPEGLTLVTANSRQTIAGFIGMGIGGGVAAGLARIGPDWALRYAFVVYAVGTVLAIRLPSRVDSVVAERELPAGAPGAGASDDETVLRRAPTVPIEVRGTVPIPTPAPVRQSADSFERAAPTPGRLRQRMRAMSAPVRYTLWLMTGSKLFSGFLTFFAAFLLRTHAPKGWDGTLLLGLVIAAAGVGTGLGSVIGGRKRTPAPQALATACAGLAIAAVLAAAVRFSPWTLLASALAAGLFGQLGKLCLDSLVQRDIAEESRGRVFGWIESLLQAGWVVGGAIGTLIPLEPRLGFGIIAGILVVTALVAGRSRLLSRRPAPVPA